MSLPLILAILLGAGLLGLALRTEEQRRSAPPLPPPAPAPPVTVLLPVRDERSNIVDCLESLLPQARVRVIDDGSTDGTRELVMDRGWELIDAGPLPDGWRGKVHALWRGWQGVDTPWILLTDADTRHGPGLVARALALAEARGLDAVSLAGRQEAHGLGENLVVPPVFAMLDALLGDWQAAASGTGPAVANGQFLLLRKEAWDAAGGFETVRNEPIDDVAIVTRLRRSGFRTAFFRAPDLRVRMYRGFGEAWRGWRRNLGGIFGPRPRTLAAILAVLLVPVLFLLGFLATGRWLEAALLWSAGAAASTVFRSDRPGRSGRSGSVHGLLYPLDALLLAVLLSLGAADRRRGRLASWKGREMKV